MEESPDLLSDGSEMLHLDVVEVELIDKVDDQQRRDDGSDAACAEQEIELLNQSNAACQSNYALAEHDEC